MSAARSRKNPDLSLRILLVDDHEDSLTALTRLLVLSGHDVRPAGTLRDARQLAAEHRCDLLITDLGLPDGSGLDLMRELKQQYALPGIALTGHAEDGDVEDCKQAGFARHLSKPVVFSELIAVIKELSGTDGSKTS